MQTPISTCSHHLLLIPVCELVVWPDIFFVNPPATRHEVSFRTPSENLNEMGRSGIRPFCGTVESFHALCLIAAPCSTRYPVPNSQLRFTPLAWPIVFLLFTYFDSTLIGFLLESRIVCLLSLSLLSERFGAQR